MYDDRTESGMSGPGRHPTGVPGLDLLLHGGLVTGNAYAVQGGPGTGKTLLGLHFVSCPQPEGHRLLVTMGEDIDRLRNHARLLGIALDGVDTLDLSPRNCTHALAYRLVSPTETDFHLVMNQLIETVRRLTPVRIFVDFARTLRLLTPDPYLYRLAMMSILRLFSDAGATTLVAAEQVAGETEDLAYMVDGVIEVASRPVLATMDRTIRVIKTRGSGFIGGQHSMRIGPGGVEVIPRILSSVMQPGPGSFATESTGLPDLDRLLGGGIEQGSTTLLTGASGTGKTTIALQLVLARCIRGHRCLVFTFDEEPEIMARRMDNLGLDPAPLIAAKSMVLRKIEPYIYSADEFEDILRKEVEGEDTRTVMIDSTAGFRPAIRDDPLVSRLHGICKYLQSKGVTTLLTTEISALGFVPSVTDQSFSYLVDNVILLRHWDTPAADGRLELRKLMLILKKRMSSFDRTVQEVEFGPGGIRILGPVKGLGSFFGTGPLR